MTGELQIIIGIFAIFSIVSIISLCLWLTRRYPLLAAMQERNLTEKVTKLTNQVAGLQATIDSLLEDRQRDRERIILLQERIQVLEVRLAIVTGKSLAEIQDSSSAKPEVVTITAAMPIKPLLLIGGADDELVKRDRTALRRTRIKFHRLLKATQASLTEELQRRRLDHTLYPWLVISAHADSTGIQLADGIAGSTFWHEQLIGIKVVLLAACSSSEIADILVGMVDAVVYFSEDVGVQDAADYIYAFWRQISEGESALDAFAHALDELPQIAEFVDIRVR